MLHIYQKDTVTLLICLQLNNNWKRLENISEVMPNVSQPPTNVRSKISVQPSSTISVHSLWSSDLGGGGEASEDPYLVYPDLNPEVKKGRILVWNIQ